MIERIVVPTDASEHATAALDHAASIATRSGATVHVLHVSSDSLDPENDPDVRRILDAGVSRLEDAGATVSSTVRGGPPAANVLEFVEEVQADTIVLGTPSRAGVKRLVLGSVTERVVRDSTVPVLVVPPTDDEHPFPYRRALVATDGSVHATAAVRRTVELASPTVETIHLLSVVDVSPRGVADIEDVQSDPFEAAARAIVADAAEVAHSAGVEDVVTAVRFGSVRREILAYAEETDAGLVGIGTHGREGVERLLLGSVAEGVLRSASVPVLTVRSAP